MISRTLHSSPKQKNSLPGLPRAASAANLGSSYIPNNKAMMKSQSISRFVTSQQSTQHRYTPKVYLRIAEEYTRMSKNEDKQKQELKDYLLNEKQKQQKMALIQNKYSQIEKVNKEKQKETKETILERSKKWEETVRKGKGMKVRQDFDCF